LQLKRQLERIDTLNCKHFSTPVEALSMSDDDELAIIRRKKMAEMIEREKQLQANKEHEQKVDAERAKLMKRFLASDALDYFESVKQGRPAVALRLEGVILDLILNRGVRQQFSLIDVRYIERQITGEETKIRVQRDGETSDFGAYVKEAIKKNDMDGPES
jgi:DNA-binding TFAR19-related protein (PDSD5 family)